MGTTLTTLLLIENVAVIGHVGDSRIYLLRDNEFNQITIDHTWVEGEVNEGRLTAEEAISHPMRNILSRAIGNNQKVDDWILEIRDEYQRIVQKYTHFRQNTDRYQVIWDGTNFAQNPLADGQYTAKVIWQNRNGSSF